MSERTEIVVGWQFLNIATVEKWPMSAKRCISILQTYCSNLSYTRLARLLDSPILKPLKFSLPETPIKKRHDVISNPLLFILDVTKLPRLLRGILLILHTLSDVLRRESKRRRWSDEACPGRSQVDFHTCQLESKNNGHAKIVCVDVC